MARRAAFLVRIDVGRMVDGIAALVWEGHGRLWWMGLGGYVVGRWIEWVGGRMRTA